MIYQDIKKENAWKPIADLFVSGSGGCVRKQESSQSRGCKRCAQRNAAPELQTGESPDADHYFVTDRLLHTHLKSSFSERTELRHRRSQRNSLNAWEEHCGAELLITLLSNDQKIVMNAGYISWARCNIFILFRLTSGRNPTMFNLLSWHRKSLSS